MKIKETCEKAKEVLPDFEVLSMGTVYANGKGSVRVKLKLSGAEQLAYAADPQTGLFTINDTADRTVTKVYPNATLVLED